MDPISLEPDALAGQRCVSCNPGTPRVSATDAERLRAGLHDAWQLDETSLSRTFELRDFNAALGLAVRIGLLAEGQGHHPDLEIGWGRVHVRWTTHAIDGLSTNDFVMAAKVDRLVARGIGERDPVPKS